MNIDEDGLTGEHKADFTNIYDQPDPRAYYRTLLPLDYQIPQQAKPVIEATLKAAAGREAPTVLDVCCSYGINAALLRYDVDLDDIGARCLDPASTATPFAEVIESDAAFYADRLQRADLNVIGLDAAPSAVDYAVRTGLLRDGWAENLEEGNPSAGLATGLRDVDMIICTGGVGYVGPATYERIVDSVADPENLWAVTFALRVFDCAPIIDVFDRAGLVTEQVPEHTFPQRRFADAAEQEAAEHDVLRRGLDPAGKEAEGWYHAECFVTRPRDAATTPISEVLAGVLLT